MPSSSNKFLSCHYQGEIIGTVEFALAKPIVNRKHVVRASMIENYSHLNVDVEKREMREKRNRVEYES